MDRSTLTVAPPIQARSGDLEKSGLGLSAPSWQLLFWGLLAFAGALPLAWIQRLIQAHWAGSPEKAILAIGAVLCPVALAPPLLVAVRSGFKMPMRVGLIFLASLMTALVSVYLAWASWYILFPGDFLIWSESDFVNDIIKFRIGYPLFTDQANNESFFYAPGSQLLTYGLAWLSGHGTSIAVYRVIQVIYTLAASLLALLCTARIAQIAGFAKSLQDRRLWACLGTPLFFLAATNSISNPFTHELHGDALVLLVNVCAFYVMLSHQATGKRVWLCWMAIIPAAGFAVKQNAALWAVLYCGYLIFSPQVPKKFGTVVKFAVFAFGLLGAAMTLGYLLWRDAYVYWMFKGLSSHGVSTLRSFQHALDIWVYLAAGALGGILLSMHAAGRKLAAAWVVWLILILTETYTSGIAWMLNHIGPGCLLAMSWCLAGIIRVCPLDQGSKDREGNLWNWARMAAAVAVVGLSFTGFGFGRLPARPLPLDSERYISEIEAQFAGFPPESTLLDIGSWVYLKSGVVMKDRAASIGERGHNLVGDFSGILRRIRDQKYRKILVRNLDGPDFWYDDATFPQSSGIREALRENYRVAGTIAPVMSALPDSRIGHTPYLFSEISVLEPRTDRDTGSKEQLGVQQ